MSQSGDQLEKLLSEYRVLVPEESRNSLVEYEAHRKVTEWEAENTRRIAEARRLQAESRARLHQLFIETNRSLGLPEYGTPEWEAYKKAEDARRMAIVKANKNYFLDRYRRDPNEFPTGSYVLVQGAERDNPVLRQGLTFDELACFVCGDCWLGKVDPDPFNPPVYECTGCEIAH
jgi:hypothetical protein